MCRVRSPEPSLERSQETGVDGDYLGPVDAPREQGAAVCEVNAGPQVMIHARPSQGPGQPVGEAIVDLLFTTSAPGRIPIAAILGSGQAADHGIGAPASATLTASRTALFWGSNPPLLYSYCTGKIAWNTGQCFWSPKLLRRLCLMGGLPVGQSLFGRT